MNSVPVPIRLTYCRARALLRRPSSRLVGPIRLALRGAQAILPRVPSPLAFIQALRLRAAYRRILLLRVPSQVAVRRALLPLVRQVRAKYLEVRCEEMHASLVKKLMTATGEEDDEDDSGSRVLYSFSSEMKVEMLRIQNVCA
jgi:hypothetical protein